VHPYTNLRLLASFRLISFFMSLLICGIGMMVLYGWITDLVVLKSLLPDYPPMQPNTAIGMILVGLALILQRSSHAIRPAVILAKCFGIVIVFMSALIMIEFISGTDFHIHPLFFIAHTETGFGSGRPSPLAIFSFILIGIALIIFRLPRTIYLLQILALIIGLIGLAILTGYAFSFHSQVVMQTYSHSSIYTAICFVLISLCLLMIQPARGIMLLFISDTTGGAMARVLVPIVIILPVLLGYLRIIGNYLGIYDTNSGIELYSICITTTLILVTLFICTKLMRADQKRLSIEKKLLLSNAELNDLYNHAPCGYHTLDENGVITRMNQTELSWLGYNNEDVIGKMKISEMLTPGSKRQFYDEFEKLRIYGSVKDVEIGMIRKNGTVFTVLLNAVAVKDAQGNFLKIRSTVFDISERKRIEQELRVSEARFHNAMDTAPIGMAIIDLSGKYVEVNQSLCQILGYSKEELLNMTFQQITHPDDVAIDVANSQKLIEGKIPLNQIEKRYVRKNGEIIWVQLTASILRDSLSNEPLYFITQVEDITDRKLTEERIRHLAYHDSLTNLPNRRLLLDRMHHAMDFAKRHQNIMALMFLDLDRFKNVNDTLGHDVGDELLKAVAARLNTALRSIDTIARVSGDEFVIILNELTTQNEASLIADKIIESMNHRFLIHGHELHVGCSIGITLYPNDALEVSDLMKKADLAMYAAKESGRNQYRFYH